MIEAAIFVVFPLCVVMAAFCDFISMKIPNRISVILALAFIAIAPFSGMDLVTFGWSLVAAAAVFTACFALFALNVMGGGDAKILSAAALWYGYSSELVSFLALTGLFGGVLAVIVLMVRANQNLLMVTPIPIPMHFFKDRAGIPYGIAIGAAALMTFPDSLMFTLALERLN